MAGGAPPRKPTRRRRQLGLEEYVKGVRACDRGVLGRAITLVESDRKGDQELAQQVLVKLLPHTGAAIRIGISGVPGVGKSTFIEALGSDLTAMGKGVAVLAVDPTSGVTRGSILGDKTRMARLSRDPAAFIRPSPSSGSLGGVARKTRESMLICEAAGFDVILVETVGVGQSETAVADMVDLFLVLMLPNAGDELQGIKRGILELADLLVVNKADADAAAARHAKREYMSALRVMRGGGNDGRQVPVLTCSALNHTGLDAVWSTLAQQQAALVESGRLQERRRKQMVRWMWSMVEERVLRRLHEHPAVAARVPKIEAALASGALTPTLGAKEILQAIDLDPE